MRPIDEAITLAVEHHEAGIVVVRVAGELSRVTACRLARLLDAHTSPGPDERDRTHVVVDLGEVWAFGVGGVEVLRHAEQSARRSSMTFDVTGVASRVDALPERISEELATFPGFATVEDALARLSRPDGVGAGPHWSCGRGSSGRPRRR